MTTPAQIDPSQVEAFAARGYSLIDIARLLGVDRNALFEQRNKNREIADAHNRGCQRWKDQGTQAPINATRLIRDQVYSLLQQREMSRPQLRDELGFKYEDINLAVESLETSLLIAREENTSGNWYRAHGVASAVAAKREAGAVVTIDPQSVANNTGNKIAPPTEKPPIINDLVVNKTENNGHEKISAKAPLRNLEVASKPGRQKIAIDLARLEELLADPVLTMEAVGQALGVSKNVIYHRKDSEPDFGAAYKRGLERREQACIALRAATEKVAEDALPDDNELCERCDRPMSVHVDHGPDEECETIWGAKYSPCYGDCGTDVLNSYGRRTVGRCKPCHGARLKELRKQRLSARPENDVKLCGCGRPHDHGGRCSYRRQTQPSLADELAIEKREAKQPQKEVSEPVAYIESKPEPQASVNSQMEVYGGVKLHQEVQVRVEEVATWPRERIEEFFGALTRIVEIPQRPTPKTIKRAWSKDFESDNTDDGIAGLTMLYLVSMLHDGMEENEKEAVWLLIKYLKRMQAALE